LTPAADPFGLPAAAGTRIARAGLTCARRGGCWPENSKDSQRLAEEEGRELVSHYPAIEKLGYELPN